MEHIRSKVIGLSLILFFLLSEISNPTFYTSPLNNTKDITKSPGDSFQIQSGSPYLFLTTVNQTDYLFSARKECYIIVEIKDTGFTNFWLDNEAYQVSYGINYITKVFSEEFTDHLIRIESSNVQFFKSLTVEPVFLAQGNVNVTLDRSYAVNFNAGGAISILLRPDFSYNWLYVEVDNMIIKRIYNTSDYPAIDSVLYAYFVQGGSYVRYDINLNPGIHTMKLLGNGSLIYKIMTNYDFDGDTISDAEEAHEEGLYNLNPVSPDIWGFFEKSDVDIGIVESSEKKFAGYFSFFIPKYETSNFFYIDVFDGNFSKFIIDGDGQILQNIVLTANYPNTSITSQYVKALEAGWHRIEYEYNATEYTNISFRINAERIEVYKQPELRDSDGDGVKDWVEYSSNLNPYKSDTDHDGLSDNLDASPLFSLSLAQNKITQVIIPTDSQTDSLINLQIKKPVSDYACTSRIWRDKLNISIFPAMRLYGNSTITWQQLKANWAKKLKPSR